MSPKKLVIPKDLHLRRIVSSGTAVEVVLFPLIALAASFALVGILLLFMGVSPLAAYGALFSGALGGRVATAQTLMLSAPLILTGLSVCFAYQTGLLNIGAEGQLQMGGLFAFIVANATGNAWLALIGGFLAGAFWGSIAGILKAWRGVNEIVSTILLNYLAIHIVHNMIYDVIGNPEAAYPTTVSLPASARLPRILEGTRLHFGFVIAVGMCVLVYLFYRHTTLGYKLRSVGRNIEAARYAGISPRTCIILAMVLAGGIGGLAGAGEILGVQYRLGQFWSRGWGIPGVAISFLAFSNPLAIVVAGFFFGILTAGATNMQAATGAPSSLVNLIQYLPVIFLIAMISWRRLRLQRNPQPAHGSEEEE